MDKEVVYIVRVYDGKWHDPSVEGVFKYRYIAESFVKENKELNLIRDLILIEEWEVK